MQKLILLCSFVVVQSVLAAEPPAKGKSHQDKVDAVSTRKDLLEQTILTLNKKKTCDGDGECEVLEMGARICGGPSAFLIVSTANPQFASIQQKAREFTAVEKELNLVDPPNDCGRAPEPPNAKCVKQECVSAGKK